MNIQSGGRDHPQNAQPHIRHWLWPLQLYRVLFPQSPRLFYQTRSSVGHAQMQLRLLHHQQNRNQAEYQADHASQKHPRFQ